MRSHSAQQRYILAPIFMLLNSLLFFSFLSLLPPAPLSSHTNFAVVQKEEHSTPTAFHPHDQVETPGILSPNPSISRRRLRTFDPPTSFSLDRRPRGLFFEAFSRSYWGWKLQSKWRLLLLLIQMQAFLVHRHRWYSIRTNRDFGLADWGLRLVRLTVQNANGKKKMVMIPGKDKVKLKRKNWG